VARLGTQRLLGPDDPTSVAFSHDGTKVAVANRSVADWCIVAAWDAVTGRLLVERTDYRALVTAIAWRADGTGVAVVRLRDQSAFVSAFTDPAQKLPNPPPAPQAAAAQLPGPDVDYLALSPDATQVAVARDPGGARFTIDLLAATPGRALADLPRQRTLGPFPGPCRELRYTAAGRLAFLSGPWKEKGDWTIAVVDPDRNQIVRTTRIPPQGFCFWRYKVSLSADARLAAFPLRPRLATNEHEDRIRVWDLVAGKELSSLPFSEGAYGTGHAFTPDGKRLIVSTEKTYVRVWDVATGNELARAPAEAGVPIRREASAVAVSPDGRRFATGRRDGRVDVWDTATGKVVVPLATHRDVVQAVAISPDSRLAATLAYDGLVRLWDLATGKPGCAMAAPLDRDPGGRFWSPHPLAFTPDGRGLLFTAGGDLAMADPTTGRPLDLPGGLHGRRGHVGGFTEGGKTLATFADDVVTLGDWPAGTPRVRITVPLAPGKPPGTNGGPEIVVVQSLALSPDGRLLFTNSIRWSADPKKGASQNANDVWDARTGKRLRRLTKAETEYPPAAFSPDARVLYLGGNSLDWPQRGRRKADALTARDPTTGAILLQFAGPPGAPVPGADPSGRQVRAVALSPDGRLLATAEGHPASSDVWLYEAASGRIIKRLSGHARWVHDLAFSPDGRRLVSVGEDQTGLVWDVTLRALGGEPDGKDLAQAWDRLAEADPAQGYAGMAALAAAPAESVRLLRANLRPASVPTDAQLDRLVAGLDADAFADRQKALAELERFGPNALAGIKARLDGVASPEVRKRLIQFLDRYDGPNPYQLRCVRGVAALEAIGTADARALLAELATGPQYDVLTREARAATDRLDRLAR
jgi:WD40 repeat protein